MKSFRSHLKSAGLTLAFLVLTLGTTVALAAGIAGTKHDFQGASWNTGYMDFPDGGHRCRPCHAPHRSMSTTLLWNHTQSTATYTLYASSTLKAGLAQPGAASKLCLSCHDGTIALDSYGGKSRIWGNNGGTNNPVAIGTAGNLGGAAIGGTSANLSNDHPIGFVYDAALTAAKAGMVTPSSTTLVSTGVPLYEGQLECSSCHDVHNGAGFARLLRVDNSGSGLCLKCHTK
jgi:predicted CXXCH cytochrome family protein